MVRSISLTLEIVALLLMPSAALAFLAVALRDALGTAPVVLEAITTVPPWARAYLLAAPLLTAAPAVGLLVPFMARVARRAPDRAASGGRPT
jgi:hypothetical protein